jgi:hypothetical protein
MTLVAAVPAAQDDPLRSRPERTNFEETSRLEDVTAFLTALSAKSPLVRVLTFGTTEQGRSMPLVTLSNPAVSQPSEKPAGRPVVFLLANIHGGEVEGKEAVQVLMRRLTSGDLRPLLDRMVVLIAPIYNIDGNEAIDVNNRTQQHGPVVGVGRRENAKGLDLNRDYMKLESPEARALAAAFTAWDPHLMVDLHTTNGSYHGYHLTQSIPLNLSLPEDPRLPSREDDAGDHEGARGSTQGSRLLLWELRTRKRGAGRTAPLERLRSSPACGTELRRLPKPIDDSLRSLFVSLVQASDRGHRTVRRRDPQVHRCESG